MHGSTYSFSVSKAESFDLSYKKDDTLFTDYTDMSIGISKE